MGLSHILAGQNNLVAPVNAQACGTCHVGFVSPGSREGVDTNSKMQMSQA